MQPFSKHNLKLTIIIVVSIKILAVLVIVSVYTSKPQNLANTTDPTESEESIQLKILRGAYIFFPLVAVMVCCILSCTMADDDYKYVAMSNNKDSIET